MRKSLSILLAVSVLALGVPGAKADTVQVGYITITSTPNSDGTYNGAVSITNTTLDDPMTITVTSYSAMGAGLPLPPPIIVPPGQTVPDLIEYTLIVAIIALVSSAGMISPDFTVTTPGGIPMGYEATGAYSNTYSFDSNFNGTMPIDVTATPIATPEPTTGALMMIGLGLLGLMMAMRKRLRLAPAQAS